MLNKHFNENLRVADYCILLQIYYFYFLIYFINNKFTYSAIKTKIVKRFQAYKCIKNNF